MEVEMVDTMFVAGEIFLLTLANAMVVTMSQLGVRPVYLYVPSLVHSGQ